MSSLASTLQPCEYCHKKDKFTGHQYCSKTCAAQAAALCHSCHKKPKYQNYDYCGKNCAASANAKRPPFGAVNGTAQTQPQTTSNWTGNSKGNAFPSKLPFDPVELAKLVAQHIPQVQALLAPTNGAPPAPASQPLPINPTIPFSSKATTNNPFVSPADQDPPYGPNGSLAASSNLPSSAQLYVSTEPSHPTECLIPGCEQPVHVDAKGLRTSDYCSMRHREEAVVSGLASPCIMCLALPQSEADYFCGRACRDEALNKPLET